MTASNAASGVMAARGAEQPDRVGLAARLQAGDQVAEPLRAADPGRRHERGQPEQLRAVGQPRRPQPGGVQPGQAAPAVQRPDQRARQVPAARIGAAADQAGPGRPRGGQQPGVVAGQHRHGPRPRAAHRPRSRRRTGARRRRRARRAGRRGPARRRPRGRPAPPPASAAPPWAARPPARGTRRSPPGRTGPWPAPAAAARPPGKAAGTTRRPMNRRFVRSVRRAAPDSPGAHRVNRSAVDGCSSTSGTGSSPSPRP